MKVRTIRAVFASAAAACLMVGSGCAAQANGQLPMYPNAKNLDTMPASVISAGVPMVLESTDAVASVVAWYTTQLSGSCTRTAQSGGIRFACPTGSIMIYAHQEKAQIAFVPSMALMR